MSIVETDDRTAAEALPAGGVAAAARYLASAAVVMVLVPLELGWLMQDQDITTLGQFALTYSLPWGAGVAAMAWLRGRAAIAAGLTVAASAVLCIALVAGTHLVAYYSNPPVAG
jgi:hypothetical protein